MGRVIQRTKRKEKIFQHFLVHKVLQVSDLQLNLLAEEDSIMTLEALTEVSEAVAVEEAVEAGEDVEMTISVEVEVLLTWDLAVEDEDVVVDLEETGTMVMVMKVLTSHPENEKKGENFPAFPGSQGPPGFGSPAQPFGRGGFNNDFGGFDGGFRGRGGRGGRGGWRGRGNDNFRGGGGPPDMGFGRGGRRGGFGGNWNDGHGDESFDESSRERKERRKFSSISWFTRSSRIRTSSSTFWPRRIQ